MQLCLGRERARGALSRARDAAVGSRVDDARALRNGCACRADAPAAPPLAGCAAIGLCVARGRLASA